MSTLTLNAAKDFKSSKTRSKYSLLSDMPTNLGNLQHLLTDSMLTVNFTYPVTLLLCMVCIYFRSCCSLLYRFFLIFFFTSKMLNGCKTRSLFWPLTCSKCTELDITFWLYFPSSYNENRAHIQKSEVTNFWPIQKCNSVAVLLNIILASIL